jgi:hypothetical protein
MSPRLSSLVKRITIPLAFVFPAILLAGMLQAGDAPPDADAAWENIGKRFRSPPERAGVTAGAQTQARTAPVATDWASVARQTREFQERFPNDARGREARGLELSAVLQQTRKQGGRLSPDESARIEHYLSDRKNPETARYNLRVLSKELRVDYSKIKTRHEASRIRIQNTKELIREFPSDPRGHGYLLSLAKGEPGSDGADLAQEIIGGSAPESIKEQARRLLAQREMEGKPLLIEGLDLTPYRGKPLLLYTWSSSHDASLRLMRQLRGQFPDVTALGINLDEDAAVAEQAIMKLNPTEREGQHLDGGGLSGPLANQLRIHMPASIYIVDAKGMLMDVCGHLEARAKLAAFVKPTDKTNPQPSNNGGVK